MQTYAYALLLSRLQGVHLVEHGHGRLGCFPVVSRGECLIVVFLGFCVLARGLVQIAQFHVRKCRIVTVTVLLKIAFIGSDRYCRLVGMFEFHGQRLGDRRPLPPRPLPTSRVPSPRRIE